MFIDVSTNFNMKFKKKIIFFFSILVDFTDQTL